MENKKYEPTDKEKKLCEWVYSKFKQSYVAKAPLMKKWQEYMSAYEAAKEYNVTPQAIRDCCNGKSKTSAVDKNTKERLVWRYKD